MMGLFHEDTGAVVNALSKGHGEGRRVVLGGLPHSERLLSLDRIRSASAISAFRINRKSAAAGLGSYRSGEAEVASMEM